MASALACRTGAPSGNALAVSSYHVKQHHFLEDSQKRFDQCELCLSRFVDPMACPLGGHIFCKFCIVENLVKQKKQRESEGKRYDRQVQEQQRDNQEA